MICLDWWVVLLIFIAIMLLVADLATFMRRTKKLRRILHRVVKEDTSRDRGPEIDRSGDAEGES